jgi:hypothetical protein
MGLAISNENLSHSLRFDTCGKYPGNFRGDHFFVEKKLLGFFLRAALTHGRA